MTSRRDFTETTHTTTYPYISPVHSDLCGRHVLIAGAAWEDGVGYTTAAAFARAGASVIVLVDLHPIHEDLIAKLKTAAREAGRTREPKILSGIVDIASWESVLALREVLLSPHLGGGGGEGEDRVLGGRLDILINNAAHQETLWECGGVRTGGVLEDGGGECRGSDPYDSCVSSLAALHAGGTRDDDQCFLLRGIEREEARRRVSELEVGRVEVDGGVV